MRCTLSRLSRCVVGQRSLRSAQERAGEAEDDGHRRAELVRHGREKAVLQGGGPLQLPRGPGDPAPLLLEQLVLLREPPRLLGEALVGRGVGEGHGEARRDRRQRVAGAVRERRDRAEAEDADDLAEVEQGNVEALPREDAPVEEVDGGRLRVDRDEKRLLLAHRAAGLVPARRAGRFGAAHGDRRVKVALAVREIEDRARGAGDLDDASEDLRSESREVVDRRGGDEHGVHGRLDVARLERPAPLEVHPGGGVEVASEGADLVVGSLGEPRRRPAGDEVLERAGRVRAGSEDAPVHVGEQQNEPDEDQAREDDESGGRGVAASLELQLAEVLPSRELALELREDLAQVAARRRRPRCPGSRAAARAPAPSAWTRRARAAASYTSAAASARRKVPPMTTGSGWRRMAPMEPFSSVRLR